MQEHNHSPGEECAACKYGMERVFEWEQEQVDKHGWFTHFVGETEEHKVGPMGVDFHTHGIYFKYGHPDLQIVLPINPDLANGLFWTCVRHIQNGKSFLPWDTATKVVGNGYRVKFIPVIEGDGDSRRHVLRIIIPDADGHLDSNNLCGQYVEQYADLNESLLPTSLKEMKLGSDSDLKKFYWAAPGLKDLPPELA